MCSQGLARGKKAGVEEEKQEAAEATQGQRQPWGTLQKSFRHVVEKMRSEEMKVAHLSHGLQHLCRVAFASPVRHVAHHSPKRSFVVLDAESTLHFLREDGSLVRSVAAPAPMTGLLYAAQVDRFVGWDTEGLLVLDSSFQLLSQVPSRLPIRCGLYSEQLNRIVTAGEGNLTLWGFRYGFRSLQCHAAVSEGLEPSNVFTHLALGADSPESQSCFTACDTGAAAFDIAKGRLLSFKKDLHSRVITGLAYCHVTGCVVTASRDTTIKVWDKNWNIQTVFVGHTAPVIAVTIYPDRPLVFSASQDGTIRTWNLDTIDQVDQVHVLEPVETLETKTASHVISTSGSSLNLWKINKLYSLYSPVGSPVKRLSCSNLEALGNFPVRLLCVGQDSTVRLVEAQSGLILSTFSLDQPSQVQEAAYCLPRETLFVLTEPGSLLRINAAADPMVLKKSTPSCSQESKPCCLLLYSHVVDPEAAYATWCEVAENKSYRKQWQRPPLQRQEKNRYLPVLGHTNGFLSVVEWFSGRTQYEVEAHGSGRVTALAEYPAQTCVISAGADLTVKMWRLFPYAEECLVPLLCFSCNSPATHMCSLGETLAVAFQDPETITHRIVYYSLMEQTCYEHKPEDDAEDEITGLCCCPNLTLFASASRDGSVKVWDIKNKLLRHLKLNTIPESLAFANRWGDLLVGIERHLYLIHHNKYLPNYYRMKFLCTKFLEPLKDIPLPLSNSCFEALVKENVRRLLHEPPLEEAESPLPGAQRQETKAPPRDSQPLPRGLSGLAERDRDLLRLQTGRMSPAKKGRVTQEMKEEAFERYLRIFYKEQPKMEIPKEDPFDADEVLEALRHVDSVAKLYGPARPNMFLGCFPRPSVLKPAEQTPPEASPPAESSSRVPSLGRIPLAVTLEALVQFSRRKKDRKEEEAALLEKEQAPPLKGPILSPREASPSAQAPKPPLTPSVSPQAISAAGSREGRRKGRRKKKSDKGLGVVHEPDTAPAFPLSSYVSPAPGGVAEAIPHEKSISFKESPSVVQRQASHKRSSSPSSRPRSQTSVIVKGFFPERHPESPEWSRSQIRRALGSRQSVPLPGISSGYIPNSVVAQQLHVWDQPEEEEEEYRQERLVEVTGPQEELESLSGISSTGVMGSEESEESPAWEPSGAKPAGSSQSPVKESPPEVFLTQLDASQYPDKEQMPPSFILPLVDTEWFQKMFPEGFPPETTLQQFLAMLLGNIVTADFNTKTELLGAVLSLKEQLKDRMRQTVYKTLLHVLNMKEGSPSMQERSQRKFILASLRALMDINKDSKELMVELVTYYVMAPPPFRAAVKDLIQDVGVQDPHDYFYKELESWPVGEQETKESVRRRSKQWLDGAMQELQEFRRRFLGQEVLAEQKSLSEISLTELRSTESPLWEHMSPEEDEDNFEEQPEWKYSSVSFEEVIFLEKRGAAAGQEGTPPEAEKAFYGHREGAEKEEMRDDLGLEEQQEGRVPARRDQEEPLGDEPVVGKGERPERKCSTKRAQKGTEVTEQRLHLVHPIDAIHHFMEKQLERELEEMKRVVSAALDTPRDTVMVLPPIRKKRAILRLGETNTMWRKRLPERFYFPYIFPRYLMKGFVPFVKLPLPKINLDVFPAPSERPLSPKTFGAMQQSVHRYFIPKFSYADSYP
nr:WD repeat-containing protein 97 isoform X1 [Pogona vitticeps]XP_020660181.1 WD repeat-containing protein 97 isoform X1 [Pogona vitticeps]